MKTVNRWMTTFAFVAAFVVLVVLSHSFAQTNLNSYIGNVANQYAKTTGQQSIQVNSQSTSKTAPGIDTTTTVTQPLPSVQPSVSQQVSSTTPSSTNGSTVSSTHGIGGDRLNWFGSLIVGFIGSFLSMISALLIAMGSNVPQVVLGNLMSNPHLAPWRELGCRDKKASSSVSLVDRLLEMLGYDS